MKSMDFLVLLGELSEDPAVQSPPTLKKRPLRRAVRIAAAACACILCLAFAVWFFTPPMFNSRDNGLHYTLVCVDGRLLFYRPATYRLSPYERLLLPDEKGELLDVHGDIHFYRVAEQDDLIYVLTDWYGGQLTVLEFDHIAYWPGVDLRDTEWYASGWITDENIAALENSPPPTLGDALEEVYGVTSDNMAILGNGNIIYILNLS